MLKNSELRSRDGLTQGIEHPAASASMKPTGMCRGLFGDGSGGGMRAPRLAGGRSEFLERITFSRPFGFPLSSPSQPACLAHHPHPVCSLPGFSFLVSSISVGRIVHYFISSSPLFSIVSGCAIESIPQITPSGHHVGRIAITPAAEERGC